jgi:hypothetical protein
MSSGWCFNGLNGDVDPDAGVLEIVLDRLAANQERQTSQLLGAEGHFSAHVSAGVRLVHMLHGGAYCHRWRHMERRLIHLYSQAERSRQSSLRRWHRKQELLNCSLTDRIRLHSQDASDASPEVRTYLEERVLIVASLFARGGSEICLQHNQPAPGLEVLTRQIEFLTLRRRSFWYPRAYLLTRAARGPPNAWIVLVPASTSPLCGVPRGMKYSPPAIIGIRSPLMINV